MPNYGQSPILVLRRRQLGQYQRTDTSAFSRLTAPPKLPTLVIPGAAKIRTAEQVARGLGLPIETEQSLAAKVREWAASGNPISYAQAVVSGSKAVFPDDPARRNELFSRCKAFWKALEESKPYQARPGETVIQKSMQPEGEGWTSICDGAFKREVPGGSEIWMAPAPAAEQMQLHPDLAQLLSPMREGRGDPPELVFMAEETGDDLEKGENDGTDFGQTLPFQRPGTILEQGRQERSGSETGTGPVLVVDRGQFPERLREGLRGLTAFGSQELPSAQGASRGVVSDAWTDSSGDSHLPRVRREALLQPGPSVFGKPSLQHGGQGQQGSPGETARRVQPDGEARLVKGAGDAAAPCRGCDGQGPHGAIQTGSEDHLQRLAQRDVEGDWFKSASHRYLKRVPTGKFTKTGKVRYRYIYKLPGRRGLVSEDKLIAGTKLKVKHAGQEGHFEVLDHDKEKQIVHVRHDESQRTVHIREHDLHRMLESYHRQRTEQAGQKAKAGAEKKPAPKTKATPKPSPKAPKEAAPSLPKVSMGELAKGEWTDIEGFAADPQELEEQAHAAGKGKQWAVIQQPNGYVLVSRSEKPEGTAKGPLEGDDTKVYLRDNTGEGMAEMPAKWVLMEADDVIASHKADTFAPHEQYPKGVQERDRARQDLKLQVDRIARQIKPAMVANTNPDAVNGAPIITEKGVVLGGNGRTMGMQRAYKLYSESGQALKEHLAATARTYGFTAADVRAMKNPVLLRKVKTSGDEKELHKLGRRMNESLTQGLDPREEEVSLGKAYVTKDVLSTLTNTIGEDQTLGSYLSSKDSKDLVAALERSGIIDDYNRAQYVNKETGLLNEEGRGRVERVLAARILPDAGVLDRMLPSHRANLARATSSFIAAEEHGWDIRPSLMRAVKAEIDMRQRDYTGRGALKRYLANEEIEAAGESPEGAVKKDEVALALLQILRDRGEQSKELPARFRGFALRARQSAHDAGGFQIPGFTEPQQTPLEALKKEFELEKPAKEQQELAASRHEEPDLVKAAAKLPQNAREAPADIPRTSHKTPTDRPQNARAKGSIPNAKPDISGAEGGEKTGKDAAQSGQSPRPNRLMNRVIWLVQDLVEAAVHHHTGAGGPVKIDGKRIAEVVMKDVKHAFLTDQELAYDFGRHPITPEVVQGLVQTFATMQGQKLAKARADYQDLMKAAQLALFGAPAKPAQPRLVVRTSAPAVQRPPAGYMAIPNSKHGGFVKVVGNKRYYWYPGVGHVGTPHPGEPAEVHAEHAAAEWAGQNTTAVLSSTQEVEHAAQQETATAERGTEGGGGGSGVLGTAGGGSAGGGEGHAGPEGREGPAEEVAPAEPPKKLWRYGDPVEQPAAAEQTPQSPPVEEQAKVLPDPAPEILDPRPPAPAKKVAETRHEEFLPELTYHLPENIVRFPHPTENIKELYPHQQEGAERIMQAWQERDGFQLLDDAGLGKTNTALAAMVARGGKRNLIVVPTSGKAGLKQQWSSANCAGLYGIQVKTLADLEQDPWAEGTFIVSYDELVRTEKQEGKKKPKAIDNPAIHNSWDTIVFDESHNMQQREGLRAEAGKRLGAKAGKVLYMSATPVTDFEHLHYLTRLGLGFDESTESFSRWAKEAGADVEENVVKNPRSRLPMAAIAATMMVDGMSLKRTATLEGLTAGFKLYGHQDLTPEQRGAFDTADRVIKMAGDVVGKGILSALYTGWAKQYWETLKIDKAVAIGKQALAEGKQVAFFTSYKASNHEHLRAIPRMLEKRAARVAASDKPGAEAQAMQLEHLAADIRGVIEELPPGTSVVKTLTEAFGGPKIVAEIHGATSKKPETEQNEYQAGNKHVCVATMARGGTGISLHDTTGERPRVQINLSIPWSGREFNQVAGRSHRLGSKSETEMHWLLGDDPNEKHNGAVVARRLKDMGSLTVGDPEETISAKDLADWEFGNNKVTDTDDAEADVQALEEAEEAAGTGEEPNSEAAQVRDYFREFAEARKGGRNVIREVYQEQQKAKAARDQREARRSAEQIRQKKGWTISHRPELGGWLLRWYGIPTDLNRYITGKHVGGKKSGPLQGFVIPDAGMPELSRKVEAHTIKVDLRELEKQETEREAAIGARKKHHDSRARELYDMAKRAPSETHRYWLEVAGQKHLDALDEVDRHQGAYDSQHRKAEDFEQRSDDLHRAIAAVGGKASQPPPPPKMAAAPEVRPPDVVGQKARLALGVKGISIRELPGSAGTTVYLFTGNTFKHKDDIKRVVGGGGFTREPAPGWKVRPDQLAKVMHNITGSDDWQKARKIILDLVKAEQMGLFGGHGRPSSQTTIQKPPGSGWESIPAGKHGGFRRRKGTGWEYWYPGQGIKAAPHADDQHAALARHHADRASEIAEQEVNGRSIMGSQVPPEHPLFPQYQAHVAAAQAHHQAAEGKLSSEEANRASEKAEAPQAPKKISIVRVNPETGKEEAVTPKPKAEPPKPAEKPAPPPTEPVTVKPREAPKPGYKIPPPPKDEEPKLVLKPQEPEKPSGKYETTGYVFGSRAELWQLRNSGELEKDPAVAHQLVTKEAVLGGKVEAQSFASEREAGTEPAAAYLKYRLMQSIQSRPDDSPEARERFTQTIGMVQKSLAEVRTTQEAATFIQDVRDLLDGVAPRDILTAEEMKHRGWDALVTKPPQYTPKYTAHDLNLMKPKEAEAAVRQMREDRDNDPAVKAWRAARRKANEGILAKYEGHCNIREVPGGYALMAPIVESLHDEAIKNFETLGPRFLAIAGVKITFPYRKGLRGHRPSKEDAERWHGAGAWDKRRVESAHDSEFRAGVMTEATSIAEEHKNAKLGIGKGDPWAWLGATKPKAEKKDTSTSRTEEEQEGGDKYHTILAQARLGAAERVGPAVSGNKGVGSEAMKKSLGLHEVEYGHWADEAEKQWHTEAAHAALHDLADILGIKPEQVGQNGRLTMAFGSRGQGAAKATYNPTVKAINITKVFGKGTLAHEWGHFLDHMMQHVDAPEASRQPYASGGRKTAVEEVAEKVSPPVAQALQRVMEAIRYEPQADPRQARIDAGRKIEEMKRAYREELYHGDKAKAEQMRLEVNAQVKDFNRMVRGRGGFKVPTDFYAGAQKMGDYWHRPTEMFARCFEAWVSDKLASQKRKNTYLVHGTQAFEDMPGFYPGGEHRQRVNAAMDSLAAALREDKHFSKAMATGLRLTIGG